MKNLLRPSVIIPSVLSLALIAGLLALSNVKTVVALILRFPLANLFLFMALMVIYEVVRGAQWQFLLKALEVRVPFRPAIYAFILSEFSRNLPVGSYFQNYLLQQSAGVDFGRTSAATTLILVSEVAICALGTVVLGLGTWTTWVRIVILAATALLIAAALVYARFHRSSRIPAWIRDHPVVSKAAEEVRRFREGAADLFHPRILVIQGLLGAAYLVIAGGGLYLVARGLDPGDADITLSRMIVVYLFTLATAAVLPLPEVGGVGALLAFNVDRNVAVSVMLLNRALSMIQALAGAAIATALLPDELRAVLQARHGKPASPAPTVPAPSRGEQG